MPAGDVYAATLRLSNLPLAPPSLHGGTLGERTQVAASTPQWSSCSGIVPSALETRASGGAVDRMTPQTALTIQPPAVSPGESSPAPPGSIPRFSPFPAGNQSVIAVEYITSDPTATGALRGASGRRSRRCRRCRTRERRTELTDLRPCRFPILPFVVVTPTSAPVCATTATGTSTGGEEAGGCRKPGGETIGIDAFTIPPTVSFLTRTEKAIPGVPFIRPIPSSVKQVKRG